MLISIHSIVLAKSGYKAAMEMLINKDIPTAIFAVNDIVALGVIQAIEEFGLDVPKDVSVIGFDDISFLPCIG